MTVLHDRNPTHAECFQALASALEILGGQNEKTSAAIQVEMGADKPDFHRAARAIGVKADDLAETFAEEMFKRGFVVARKWLQ